MNNPNGGAISQKLALVLNAILNAPQLDRATIRTIYSIIHLVPSNDPKESQYTYAYTDYDKDLVILRMHIHVMNNIVRVTLITTDLFEITDIPNDSWKYICWILEDKAYEEKKRLDKIEKELLSEQGKPETDKDPKLIEKLENELEFIIWQEE